MICSMCNKNQASIFSSKITPDGKREMEGLCINCAKKLGINTDEILKAQNQTIINNQSEQMNKQLEGLFKNLSENLGSIDGIELGSIPIDTTPFKISHKSVITAAFFPTERNIFVVPAFPLPFSLTSNPAIFLLINTEKFMLPIA